MNLYIVKVKSTSRELEVKTNAPWHYFRDEIVRVGGFEQNGTFYPFHEIAWINIHEEALA